MPAVQRTSPGLYQGPLAMWIHGSWAPRTPALRVPHAPQQIITPLKPKGKVFGVDDTSQAMDHPTVILSRHERGRSRSARALKFASQLLRAWGCREKPLARGTRPVLGPVPGIDTREFLFDRATWVLAIFSRKSWAISASRTGFDT